jgi:hypothetical protein
MQTEFEKARLFLPQDPKPVRAIRRLSQSRSFAAPFSGGFLRDQPARADRHLARAKAQVPHFEIHGLRQQRRRPGPKPTDDWPIELAAAVIRKALDDSKALENVDALVETKRREVHNPGRG